LPLISLKLDFGRRKERAEERVHQVEIVLLQVADTDEHSGYGRQRFEYHDAEHVDRRLESHGVQWPSELDVYFEV